MTDWWNGLGVQLQIFYGIGLLSVFVLIVQSLLLLLGVGDHGVDVGGVHGGFDVHADASTGGADGGGLHVLSVRSITAFFAGFGWAGAIATEGGLGIGPVIAVAVAVGAVFMMLVYYLMRALFGLRDSGTLDYRNAVGGVGTVYMAIPPAQSGVGQVQIVVQGSLRTLPACTRGTSKLASNTRVKVIDLADAQTLLVEAVS
ncbi:MAG: hypothetical protein IT442_16545 [Phycisphaeraceae bacterium]|nr:hypothetical protein [Phycisphaeraceae bacterium]